MSSMQRIQITKKIVRTVVSISVGRVISSIIVNNATISSTTDKVAAVTSSYVLGSMVADAAGDYTDKTIDEIYVQWTMRNAVASKS